VCSSDLKGPDPTQFYIKRPEPARISANQP
jgi:hypothetical protein